MATLEAGAAPSPNATFGHDYLLGIRFDPRAEGSEVNADSVHWTP